MDAIDRFGAALVQAGHRRQGSRRHALTGAFAGRGRALRPLGSLSRVRVALLALALALTTTAIALAASGVILTGAPVRTAKPSAIAGEGIPVLGGTRLLSLRAPDPAGGLPWGMRVVHTTRGLICVQIGRVEHGQLGELGSDGAFHDDGLFHPLPADALPDVLTDFQGWNFENCAGPGETYAGDSVGLEASAASNPPPGHGVAADRREISFGLLGRHAVSITFRSGSVTRTQPVLPGLGAFLIVQRYTSGRRLGGVSETGGSDAPFPYSGPADPNGALTAITYRYDGKLCTITGKEHSRPCGLSNYPPPRPAPLPVTHEPLRVHLEIHGRLIAAAELTFTAPYPVTSAAESYYVSARIGRVGVAGAGSDSNVARGATVSIPIEGLLSAAGTRTVTIEVSYTRFGEYGQSTTVGTSTIHVPPGTHARPLRRLRRPGA
jgi:hypothetical protein